ncbi:MAG TPA: outer membrane beta-barrel protein [Chitinophagaceae bacterium]|nr:outer membrane beta-barrel protein [Chitinophagaceae bacterium]
MDKNSFEKQVQQKMNELRMQPSDAAWKNIEERIKERRPSRKWLLLLLLLAGLGGGGYWVWNNFNRAKTNMIVQKNVDNKNIRDRSTEENNKNRTQANSPAHTVTNEQNSQQRAAGVNSSTISGQLQPALSKKLRLPVSVVSSHHQQALQTKDGTLPDIRRADRSETGSAQMEIPGYVKNIAANQRAKEINIFSGEITGGDKKIKSSANNIAANKTGKKQNVKHTWRFGATMIPGISGAGSHFLALNNRSAPDYLNLAGSSSGPPGAITPSPLKASFGFAGGIYAEKPTGKNHRWTFRAGVSFISYNLNNKVLADSSRIPNVLRGGPENYQNHFGFISIPLSMKFQLNRSESVPVFLQGGAAISQLIYANALQLNYNTGYYYHDNSQFNKISADINTGAAVELFSRKKIPVLIGPYMSYSLLPVAKSGLYRNAHFAFAGLNISATLKK